MRPTGILFLQYHFCYFFKTSMLFRQRNCGLMMGSFSFNNCLVTPIPSIDESIGVAKKLAPAILA